MRLWLPLAVMACGGGSAPEAAPLAPAGGVAHPPLRAIQSLRNQREPIVDPSNAYSGRQDAAALGRQLFYDPKLSPSGQFACSTCHKPELHFTDGLPLGVAAGTTGRHVPGIEGSQQGPWFFWDGRVDSLWAQAMGPIESPDEMASDRVFVARYVTEAYGASWAALFGEIPPAPEGLPLRGFPGGEGELGAAWEAMSPEQQAWVNARFVETVKAIAAFEATLVPGDASFDAYVDARVAGDATGGGHLTDAQVRGLSLFVGRANCVSCHLGPYFTDQAFHNLGLEEPRAFDMGRTAGANLVLKSPVNCRSEASDAPMCEELRFLNPSFDDFQGAFKTPTLRNVAETAPYMHNGLFASLDEVLDFYNTLPTEPIMGHRELTLQPLGLDPEARADLMAFLASLTGPVAEEGLPPEASP